MQRLVVTIDPSIHKAAKVYAAENGMTLKDVVVSGILSTINGHKTPRQKAAELAGRQ